MFIKLSANLLFLSFILGEKSKIYRKINNFFLTLLLKKIYSIYKKRGVEGWNKFWRPMFTEFGRRRSAYIKEKMNIDINHAGSIGRYHDYEDPICNIEGHWEVFEPNYSVRVETKCSMADKLEKISGGSNCPEFCRELVMAFESETGKSMNKNYKVEIEGELLTEGATSCRFVHKLEK